MIKMKFSKDEVVSGKTLWTRYFYSQFCMKMLHFRLKNGIPVFIKGFAFSKNLFQIVIIGRVKTF